MRTFVTFISISLLLMIGCGEDGVEGKAFIQLDWDYSFLSYWDNNPGIPYFFYENTNYECDAGTYSFQYECDNGSEYRLWEGTYTITKNPGEKGSLLVDGNDGADKHFILYLRWSGATISSKALTIIDNEDVNPIHSLTKRMISTKILDLNKNVIEQKISDGNVTIELKYWLVN